MKLLVVSHQRDAGPGVFSTAVTGAGAELDVWHRAETDAAPAPPHLYDGVIVLGGAMHADQVEEHPWLADEKSMVAELLERGTPLLGVCLGAQLLAEAAGGKARRAAHPEIGWYQVETTPEAGGDPLIGPLEPSFEAFEWHSYECLPPADAIPLARTPLCLQAFRVGERAWGIQFHAEVSRTDLLSWIDGYGSDPDAVSVGVDPVRLREQSESRVAAHNELGRQLCGRFVATLETACAV